MNFEPPAATIGQSIKRTGAILIVLALSVFALFGWLRGYRPSDINNSVNPPHIAAPDMAKASPSYAGTPSVPSDPIKTYYTQVRASVITEAYNLGMKAAQNTGTELSFDRKSELAKQAVRAGYKALLSKADYEKAFAGSRTWTWATYKQKFNSGGLLSETFNTVDKGSSQRLQEIKANTRALRARLKENDRQTSRLLSAKSHTPKPHKSGTNSDGIIGMDDIAK